MKYDKFFQLAKEAGLQDVDLYIGNSTSLSFALFHKEIDQYENHSSTNIIARGIYNGKFGAASCDSWQKNTAQYLVREIKENASVIENDDPAIIFAGSEKYKKVSTYSKELEKVSFEEKLSKLQSLDDKIRALDSRITEVAELGYEESSESITILNSKGLKLSQKLNYFVAYGSAVANENGQTKSDFDLYLGTDFKAFDIDQLAKRIVDKTVSQLGGEACETGKYKAVLAPNVVSSFLHAYIDYASSEEVQKKSSLFIDKLGKKIASSKITIEDRPIQKTMFARWFDDEGVATYNKPIIKAGVLQTYLYNLKTAAKDNVVTTGNGFRSGSSIDIAPGFIYLKPGKKSQNELFEAMGDGVYITSVQGLHAGLNPQSGDFSLQSTGFLIKDGKLDHPLDLITVSGNLIDVFKDVLEVGSDVLITPNSTSVSSLLIKKLAISGK